MNPNRTMASRRRRTGAVHLAATVMACLALGSAGPVGAQDTDALLQQLDTEIQQLRQELGRSFIHGWGSRRYRDEDDMTFLATAPVLDDDAGRLQAFFEGASVSVHLLPPYSLIRLDAHEQDLPPLLGYPPDYLRQYPQMVSRFTPVRVAFADGSEAEASNLRIERQQLVAQYEALRRGPGGLDEDQFLVARQLLLNDDERNVLVLASPKPVAAVTYAVTLPLPQRQVVPLQPDQRVATDAGALQLDHVGNNVAILLVPEALVDQVGLVAQDADGRFLEPGYSKNSAWLSGKQEQAHQERLQALQAARARVEDGRIGSRQALEDHLHREAASATIPAQERRRWVYQAFGGPVDRVQVVVSGTRMHSEARYTVTLTVDDDTATDWGHRLATDFRTGKLGILGNDGQWLVAPRFAAHGRTTDRPLHAINRYYFATREAGQDRWYRLDAEHGRLEQPAYRLTSDELMGGRYARVKAADASAEQLGLVDARTGATVVPLRYDEVAMDDDARHFFGMDGDARTDVYGKDGQLGFALQGMIRGYDGDFFYVLSPDGTPDAYDLRGRNITRGRFGNLSAPYLNGRMHASRADDDTDDGDEHAYFINETGAIVIDVAARGWANHETYFKTDLIAVQDADSGLYGFADTDGELALPYAYHHVLHGFMPNSGLAAVQQDADSDRYDFIDRSGTSHANQCTVALKMSPASRCLAAAASSWRMAASSTALGSG